MSEAENPFLRQRVQGEVETHTGKAGHSALTTRSFSIYHEDISNIEQIAKELNKYSRKKVNNSLVVRVALNYLKEALDKGGTRFDQDIERVIKDSL